MKNDTILGGVFGKCAKAAALADNYVFKNETPDGPGRWDVEAHAIVYDIYVQNSGDMADAIREAQNIIAHELARGAYPVDSTNHWRLTFMAAELEKLLKEETNA